MDIHWRLVPVRRPMSDRKHVLAYMESGLVLIFWMENRESIIADLRRMGVQVNQILSYRPTDRQLKDMRDGLLRLNKRLGVPRN